MPVGANDKWMHINSISIREAQEVRRVTIDEIDGSIFLSPSSYLYKGSNFFVLNIDDINPAWLYTAADYKKPTLTGEVIFKNRKNSVGVRLPMVIPNRKHEELKDSVSGEAMNFSTYIGDNVAVNYFGASIPSDPVTPTISQRRVPANIRIVQQSLTEYDIHILSPLTSDELIMMPVSNPKIHGNTIFGEAGTESTLPPGAMMGIVKVKQESKVTQGKGVYLVTGAERTAITNPSTVVFTAQSTQSMYAVPPAWWTNPTNNVQATTQWRTINTMIQQSREIYAAGYESSISTVGTGIFVKNNLPHVLSWSSASTGISHRFSFAQDPANIVKTVKVKEMVDATGFIAAMKDAMVYDIRELEIGTMIPTAAADVQVSQVLPQNGAGPISDLNFLYRYPLEDRAAAQVTPIVIPIGTTYHCYTPRQTYSCGMRVHLIQSSDIDADVNLIAKLPSTLIDLNEGTSLNNNGGGIKRRVYSDPGVHVVGASDPVGDYIKDWWGFSFFRTVSTSTTSELSRYRLDAYWWNPELNVTFSEETNARSATAIPVISDMTTIMVGFLTAGTPAGVYKFKPFSTYMEQRGTLDSLAPEFVPSTYVAYPVSDKTDTPFLGLNLIDALMPSYDWLRTTYALAPYDPKLPTLRAVNTMEAYKENPDNVNNLITLQIRLLLEDARVPLVGYAKKATAPSMVEVPENGEDMCFVRDLCVTAPYFSIYDNTWVITVASAELHMIYILEVDMSDDKTYFNDVIRTIRTVPLWECPYGEITEVIGLAQYTEIRYEDGIETNSIAMYVRLNPVDPILSPLTIIILKDDFTFDMSRDSVIQLPVHARTEFKPYANLIDIEWPKGIAVMFPYIYVLGYFYNSAPSDPVLSPLDQWEEEDAARIASIWKVAETEWKSAMADWEEAMSEGKATEADMPIRPQRKPPIANMENDGWQMCMWRTDVIAGSDPVIIPLASGEHFRFNWGLPARERDYTAQFWEDTNSIGEYAKYMYGLPERNGDYRWPNPVSATLPMISKAEYPLLTSVASVSALLICNHIGYTGPVIINPVTGYVEEWGLEQFPFAAVYNHNVTAAREYLFSNYPMNGKVSQSAHPFMHICIGDGLPPTQFSSSIDLQDVSYGRTLVRMAFIHNNLVRDVVSRVRLTVPDPSILEHSEMLWLGLTKEGPWAKAIELPDEIRPCESSRFYIKVEPEYEVPQSINLYIQAKFLRATAFYGYKEMEIV